MFAIGELVHEMVEDGISGRVVAVYTEIMGIEQEQEVYVQPQGTDTPDAQVRFLASELMLSDEKLERTSKYGFELSDVNDDGNFTLIPVPNRK